MCWSCSFTLVSAECPVCPMCILHTHTLLSPLHSASHLLSQPFRWLLFLYKLPLFFPAFGSFVSVLLAVCPNWNGTTSPWFHYPIWPLRSFSPLPTLLSIIIPPFPSIPFFYTLTSMVHLPFYSPVPPVHYLSTFFLHPLTASELNTLGSHLMGLLHCNTFWSVFLLMLHCIDLWGKLQPPQE
jgi:hypothetical protein